MTRGSLNTKFDQQIKAKISRKIQTTSKFKFAVWYRAKQNFHKSFIFNIKFNKELKILNSKRI